MTMWRGSAALLGKVPWHDEFLTEARLSSELRAFADWMFRNSHQVVAPLSRTSSLGEAPTYGYLMHLGPAADPHHGVAGVVGPSADRSGRPYPLAVAASVAFAKEIDTHPHVAPIVLETYWQLAVDVLTVARASPLAVDDHGLQRLVELPFESLGVAHALYTAWARRTGIVEFCELLERPLMWLAHAAEVIAGAVSRREVHRQRALRVIRVPLGRAGGGALCFWLDLLGRAARWPGYIPSFFWSHDQQCGEALLCLGSPGDTTLATLWRAGAQGDDDDACDLTLVDGLERKALLAGRTEPGGFTGNGEDSLWAMLERVRVSAPRSVHRTGTGA